MLLRRKVKGFAVSFEWDGETVTEIVHEARDRRYFVGSARGLRTAAELMREQEEELHKVAQGMEMPRR